MTWGVPGEPQIAAIKVARDFTRNTFTFESSYHATVSFAQNWLIERGCPPERITQVSDGFLKPADDLTARIEQQLRTSGARYEVLDSYTSDYDPCETWTLAHDSHAAQAPVRLFLEEWAIETNTYTLREGAFGDQGAAHEWLEERSTPLPRPPEHRGEAASLRARAALIRSPDTAENPSTGSGAGNTPAAGTAERPSPRKPR